MSEAIPGVVDALVKSTAVLACAWAIAFALRGASAAARHLVWSLALASLLALPLLSAIVPAWHLPITSAPSVAVAPAPAGRAPATTRRSGAAPGSPAAGPDGPVLPARAADAASPLTLPAAVVLLWVAGAAALVGQLLIGTAAVWHMTRRTNPITDDSWLSLVRRIARRIGVADAVPLKRSSRTSTPMAWGLLSPVVLLPADADRWTPERREVVLLHELAHVKRRDCLTKTLAQLGCALFWFNPFVWLALRQLHHERERACDDVVLEFGTSAPAYATHLLEIARSLRPAAGSWAAVSMARPSQLEGRLLAILDPSLSRRRVASAITIGAVVLAGAVAAPIAALRTWAATPEPSASQPVPATPPQEPDEEAEEDEPSAGQEQPARPPEATRRAAVDALVQAMKDSDAAVRHQAITALAQFRDERALPALNAALTDASAEVRKQAVFAMGQLRAASTVEPLIESLKDQDAEVREQAAFALGQIRDTRAVPPLTAALSDRDASVRQQAVFALGQIRDVSSVDALVGRLRDEDAEVRQQAVFALGQLRDPRAAAPLAAALEDSDAETRQQAAFGLGQLRSEASVDPLLARLDDPDADVRQQVVFALGQIRSPRAVDGLIAALDDEGPDVRQQAAFALGQLRSTAAVDRLVAALKDADEDVRQQAAFALGQIRDPRALGPLTAALEDSDADVREQAAFAIGQIR
jgi:HEAT repeat protein/beta-lactamase regulating signal transducer with metallopeptidase domain